MENKKGDGNRMSYNTKEINSLEKLKEALKIELIEKMEHYWNIGSPIRQGDELEWMEKSSDTWTPLQFAKQFYYWFWRDVMGKDIIIDVLFQYYAENTRGDYWELERDANRWRMLVDAVKEERIVEDILEVTED